MKIPTITGIIRRRILLNYQVDPDVVQQLLPANFRPKLVRGKAIAGVCLIRLEQIRPQGLPALFGISSENAAHRIAAEWEDASGNLQQGVYVPRRDTNSRLNSLAGGRIFPGVHRHSSFTIQDQDGHIRIRIDAHDLDAPLVDIEVQEPGSFPTTSSVFSSLKDSSRFFEKGCIGYSARPSSNTLDGLLLSVPAWRVSPLDVKKVHSAFYDDPSIFPRSSIAFDHALLMRDIRHEWRSKPQMLADDTVPLPNRTPATSPDPAL